MNKVSVTSTVTSTCCSTCTAVGSSVKSRPANKSKRIARRRSVKPTKGASAPKSKSTDKSTAKSSTSTTASGLESTAKNTYIEPNKEQSFRYVLPEFIPKPGINHLDDSKKASDSFKNGSVKKSTLTSSAKCIAPTASTLSYTMDRSYLQSMNKELSRHLLPEIRQLYESQEPSNPYKNESVGNYMKYFPTALVPPVYPSSNTLRWNNVPMGSSQLSANDTFRCILPEMKLQPEVKKTDSGKKESNPHKHGSVKNNTKTLYSSIASTSSNTMDNNILQTSAKDNFRYVVAQIKLPPNIKHLDSSKKAAYNSFKNRPSTENTEGAVSSMGTPAYSSIYTTNNIHGQFMRPQLNQTNSFLQPSSQNIFRYVLPETKLPPKIKHLNSSKKTTSNSFKNGSSTENTEAAVARMGTPASSSSYTMDNIYGQFIRPQLSQTHSSLHPSAQNLFRYVLPEIKLPPKIKHLDSSKRAAFNSFKNGSSTENTEAAVASMGTPASSSIYTTDNIHGQFIRPQLNQTSSSLQPSTNGLFRYVLPETRHLDNSKKSTSDSFKNGSSTENTEAAVASMRTPTSSSTMDENSLQSSSKPATSEETFKPVMIQYNSAKNPDPVRTGSPIDNTEVAATRSKGTFAGSFYIIGDDGKFSVLVTDNNGEPTSKIKFRSDGTPDEKAYPVDFSKFDKPEMAAILRYEIEKTLRNAGEVTNIYHIYIKETIRVELTVKNLQKHSDYKGTKGSEGTENKSPNISPYEDRLKEHLKLAEGILPQLPKDISRLREVFECINSDRALLERKLDSMQNAHLSIAESAEAYNANQVMNLWLDRFHKLLGKSDERIKRFDSIRNEIIRMFVYEQKQM